MSGPLALPLSPNVPPLTPTAQQAQAQLAAELSKPQYQAARPSLVQSIVQDIENWFENWFNSVFSQSPFAPGFDATPLIVTGIVVLVVALAAVGYFVFGRPRLRARRAAGRSLFGEEDERDAAALRRDAERAAAAGDFTAAIEDAFRAIARGLTERTVVATYPGTTAHGFADEAAAAFPAFAAQLGATADVFDGVRYLGRAGTREEWLAVSELERELRAARPVLEETTA